MNVVEPDYTTFVLYCVGVSLLVVVSIVAAVLIGKANKKKRKANGQSEQASARPDIIMPGALIGSVLSLMLVIGMSLFFQSESGAYNANVGAAQETLNDKYSGDFTITEKGTIDFSHLDEVESDKIMVERKLDGEVYVYRLIFVDGEPDVMKVNTADAAVSYPPLTK